MNENLEQYLKGRSVVDINANYDLEDIANVRRQISAYSEYLFNREIIKNEYDREEELLLSHKNEIYIHDFSKLILMPYCYSYSLFNIWNNGLDYYDNFPSKRPKRLDSFISLVIEFSSYAANRTRGAIAFPDLIPFVSYYQKKGISNYELMNNLQRLFYSWNQNLRQGAESLFTNISFFDRNYIESLFGDNILPVLDLDIDDVINTQRKIMEFHTDEILNRNMLRFPVITCAISKTENGIGDPEFLDFALEQNYKHCMYNFLVMKNLKAIASCCRLINDGENPFLNSYGSGSIDIGSSQVVSLNLPGLVIRHDDWEDRLYEYLDLSLDFLEWHRQFLYNHSYLDKLWGLEYRHYNRLLSTIGIIGLWDFKHVTDMDWIEIRDLISDIQTHIKSKGSYFNMELVPAESAAISLFKKDKKITKHDHYSNIEMYSNQIVAPWDDMSFVEKIKISSLFSKLFDGGQMQFLSIGEAFPTSEQMKTILSGVVDYEIPYFCFDSYLTRCDQGHVSIGNANVCHVCSSPNLSKFRRIVGYFVELSKMHERKDIDIPNRRNI